MQLLIYIVPSAELRLEQMAKEKGRTLENLAAAAVEQAALDYFQGREDDPVRAKMKEMKDA